MKKTPASLRSDGPGRNQRNRGPQWNEITGRIERNTNVEDQRFLGEEGFGEGISREAGEKEERKAKQPLEVAFREIARRLRIAPEGLRGRDRRWEISRKRADVVALLVRERGYRVSEVATYLRRDQANISTMLSRLSARERD
jgi:hypothetical protein